MTSTSYLQLYLDTDYILPVAVGVDGNLAKYQNQEGSSRLWLYFSKNGNSGNYETGPAQKANFEAKLEGNYGDFWTHLETGDKVGAEPFTYIELLEVADLLDTLREWSKPMLGTPTPDLVLNFATTIGIKARRTFVDFLVLKGFSIRSYSVEMNDLIAEKLAYDHRSTMHRSFGDQLLVMQSTGSQILLSTMTWCGETFMQGVKPTQLKKQGDDFKKTALATMVVAKMEQYNNMLNESEKPAEIAFQTQFANEWLKNRDGDTIRVRGFYYSRNPGQVYPSLQIDAKQLDLLVADNSRETTNKVAKYYRENVVNNHLHTIFFGDVFRDELFMEHCIGVTSSQGKFTFFNDNALQEAMGRYYYLHGDENEPVDELERRYMTLEGERERIRKYVKNAETLGSLRASIEVSKQETREAINHLQSTTNDIEDSWTAYMKDSKFDEAEKVLRDMSMDETLAMALRNLFTTLQKVESNVSLLTDLKQLNEVHVQEIVNNIEQGFEHLQQLQVEAKELEKRPNELRERTQHYRNVYNEYLKEKQKLNKEKAKGKLRQILDYIKENDLTMEPQKSIDIDPVYVELTCKVESKSSGFLNLKKEKSLVVTMQVKNGAVLPCPCVLQITERYQVELDRSGWYADVSANDTHFEVTISQKALPPSPNGKYYLQLFPDENNAQLTNDIHCEEESISL